MDDLFPGLARPPRSHSADIVVGLGARAAASAGEVLELIDGVLRANGLDRSDVAACVTLDRKASHQALREAAKVLGVPLLGRSRSELDLAVPTPSSAVFLHVGLSSVAEAAAMSYGSLVARKARSANATCALSRLSAAHALIAARAASTLSTSSAGP